MDMTNFTLVKKSSIHYSKYICFNNEVYAKNVIPEEILPEVVYTGVHVPTSIDTTFTRGRSICSSFVGHYLAQYAFCEYDPTPTSVNEYAQWLSTSHDLNEPAYIGYIFTTSETHYLRKVELVPRLGPVGIIGKKTPSPKEITIEFTNDNGETWTSFTDDKIILEDASFLEKLDIDFETGINVSAKGFRVVIHSWYPGAEEDMLVGLYRCIITTEPAEKVFIPKIETEYEDFYCGILKKGYKEPDKLEKPTKKKEAYKKEVVVEEKETTATKENTEEVKEDKSKKKKTKKTKKEVEEKVENTTTEHNSPKHSFELVNNATAIDELVHSTLVEKEEYLKDKEDILEKIDSLSSITDTLNNKVDKLEKQSKITKKKESTTSKVSKPKKKINNSSSISSFISKYDGVLLDTSSYDKVKLDVALGINDSKYIDFTMRNDSIVFINNTSNKGTLALANSDSNVNFRLENKARLFSSITFTKDGPSAVLYREDNIITVTLI